MLTSLRQYRCPLCNGRLFDYIKSKRDIMLKNHDCQLIIKCWKCRANIKVNFDDLT